MPEAQEAAGDAAEKRNFFLLALHLVVIRVGWIFKTESVIMPAFLDSIAGPAWMRGLLPVLNRVGQSVPSFALSDRLVAAPLKKRLLAAASLGTGVAFLAMAAGRAYLPPRADYWPLLFLFLYLLSWCGSGLHLVLSGTLQGKLVQPRRRGRLIALSSFGSMVPAVTLAWWLLPGWLEAAVPAYDRIFGFTGLCFAGAALVALALVEQRDDHATPRRSFADQVRGAVEILRDDRDYRRTVVVASLFASSIMVFPHYQALARERLDLAGSHLMVWVVVQNVSMGFASLVVGPAADRFGNRLALRVLVFAAAAIPLFSLALTFLSRETASALFPLIFAGIGLVPIGFRVITNYLLEISPAEQHPRYLSLNQLCTAASFLASPLFGLLIDLTSFEVVFALSSGLLLLGGALTFGLVEPRDRR